MTNYKKLQQVLTELFQLDKAELDFGIYRIMNQKRDDVLDFLSNKLPKEVRSILEGQQQGDATALKTALDNAIKTAIEFGAPDPEATPKVQEARTAYESAGSIDALEQEVFSHLASFFKRYYQGGDFISLRRYKKDVYAIPYEGEEVKLHWANHDQYYIKTSENLKNYAFKLNAGKTVRFTLKEASTEQNNNKTQKDQERRFALYEEEPVTLDGDTIHLNFTYEPHKKTVKQDALLATAIAQLTDKVPAAFTQLFALAPTEKNKTRTLLEKHLNDFSARNTFDYFIHKDLGGFLTRELDFYIKNEVLFIDDINTSNEQAFTTQIAKIRALKQVASKIISFLAQLENFQKKLWLKKKFVISCDYCITLDKIPESYYPVIIENQAQLKEWKTLFDVAIKTVEHLKEEPFLVLDTQFFSQEFKDNVLANFDNLDEQTDGVLINAENFQALGVIQEKEKRKIQTTYIDPPYNTDASKIIYKNEFEHSSWISLLAQGLLRSKPLLKYSGVLNCAIDDFELSNLQLAINEIYGKENFLGHLAIQIKPSGRTNDYFLATSHEYILNYAANYEDAEINFESLSDEKAKQYKEEDETSKFKWRDFLRTGGYSTPQERPNSYYPIYLDTETDKLSLEKNINSIEILPLDSEGKKRVWRKTRPSFEEHNNLGEIKVGKKADGSYKVKIIDRIKLGTRPKSMWFESKYDSSSHGTKLIANILGKDKFSFPKSIYAVKDTVRLTSNKKDKVLDYFAGSGTTGHATIKLNREDKGSRKYILVEMGEYFNTVTKPRIQKVIYSDNWKNGKPQDKKGISQLVKYFNLESYEDALNNLQLQPTQAQQKLLGMSAGMQEEYLLQYMLDVESRGHLMNIQAFKNPFNYQLNVTENNALVPTKVDLVETFNYLIGLHVKRVQRNGAFKTVEGITNAGDKTLVIWRNLEESTNDDLNAFVKKMDYNLRDGEFDTIYVNGDNNLANLRQDEETWKVLLLEEVFFTAMFDVKDV